MRAWVEGRRDRPAEGRARKLGQLIDDRPPHLLAEPSCVAEEEERRRILVDVSILLAPVPRCPGGMGREWRVNGAVVHDDPARSAREAPDRLGERHYGQPSTRTSFGSVGQASWKATNKRSIQDEA
jgi:hypothetical protein